MNRYSEALEFVHKNSTALFSLDLSDPWNDSANEWSSFQQKHPVYQRITRQVLECIGLREGSRVLEFGCGPGLTSIEVVNRLGVSGALVAMDASPQMVSLAKQNLKGCPGATATVGDARLPLFGPCAFSQNTRHQFDVVLVLFAFHEMTDQSSASDLIASWAQAYLRPDGRAVVVLHNGVLSDIATPPGFPRRWPDPLRDDLEKLCRLAFGPVALKPAPVKLNVSAIKNDLERRGFSVRRTDLAPVGRTMSDRIDMWRVPAILNSLVDLKTVPYKKCQPILEQVGNDVYGKNTMPTTVVILEVAGGSAEETRPSR
jgi:SAM-dependent methyltransferase